MTADEVITSLRRESWLNGVVKIKGKEFPATFLFKTANGYCGLLRILGVTEDDRGWNRFGMQFHYKLVESRTNQPAQR